MQIKCSICQRTIEVKPGEDPAKVQCKFCQQMFRARATDRQGVEISAEKIITQCPHCQRQFKMYSAAIGRNIKCLNCGKEYIVEQFEAKEQSQPTNQQINKSESANAVFDEYNSEFEQSEKIKTFIIYSAVWFVLASLAAWALTADIVKRAKLVKPNMKNCIKCGKPATRTSQFGNDESFGKFGPYIRKDCYDNCEEKRLCYLCRTRMKNRRQMYTLRINGRSSGMLSMDLCRWCHPPKKKTLQSMNQDFYGPEIEITKWKDYPFCDKCVDFEWMNADMLSTIPRKFILPVILLIGGLFAGVAGLGYKMMK